MTALEWDISEISEINTQCCHMRYKNGTQKALHTPSITTEVLQYLFNMIQCKKEYYSEMSKELLDVCTMKWKEIDKLSCPSSEEISHAGLFQKIDLVQQQEKYMSLVNQNSGIGDAASMATDKHHKYWRLAKQFAVVLQDRGLTVSVKY